VIEVSEGHRWVPTALGRLWTRSWTPAGAAPGLAPILLFHDSLGCVELWRGFPAALAAATGRSVVAYDRLGFGRSDPHPGRLELDFVADEALTAVPRLGEVLGFDRFVACGHSVGGGMATETAARLPERCEALVTIGAQAFVETLTLDSIRAARPFFAEPANLARLAKYHGEKAAWVVEAWIGTWLRPEFARWSLDSALAAVRCPILAIHGERDEYGSPAQPRRIAGRKGIEKVLPGIGHVPHREDEALVVDLIRRFLQEPIRS
jgi:pimeloyl-ACP methyl ester carboxylesterase